MTHASSPRKLTRRSVWTLAPRTLATCGLALAALSAAAPIAGAQTGQFTDPAGDLLPTYTAGPRNGDLDVLSGAFQFNGSQFLFSGTLAGPIGFTPGTLYVWGINRGQGTARFFPALPNTNNILFDAVLVFNPGGTSSVRDLLNNTGTNLGPSDVGFTGNTFFALVNAGLLPSTGFAPTAYTANLWPRLGAGNNNQIADFAPDNSNITVATVATVPEPTTFALLAPALGGILTLARRRRRA
ncbi:MAG: PEP-CTERM sorting domain-containing protein [Gemmatimonadaceae bacterium]